MKKKELMRRLSAVTMATMMTVTMIPSNAFAADIEFSDGGQDAIEVQADTDEEADAGLSVQNEKSEDAENLTIGGTSQDDTGAFSVEEDENVTDSDDVDVFSDAESDTASDAEAKAAAEEYLKTNYIEKNKIITTGGNSVVKSSDGLSYFVGLKTPSGGELSSLRLKYEGSSSSYKTGWYFDEEASNWLNIGSKKPATNASIGISKRPTTEKSFTATLRLFSADTSTDIINNVNEASTAALATQEFKITLEPAEPNYTMTVKVVDADDHTIDLTADATIELIDENWDKISLEDGSYKMKKGVKYTLTVTRDGYLDYKDSYFTFNPTEENTVRTVQLQKKIIRNIRFNVTDKATGNPITGSTVTLKKAGDWNSIKAEDDGSYKLVNGVSYNYTIEATNYKTVNGSITPDANKTIDIQMEKDISKYNVTFKPVDFKGADIANAKISVTYEEEDDYGYGDTETIAVTPKDGVYTLDKNTTYDYTIEADGYKKVTGSYKPSGDEENITVPVLMGAANVSEADQATVEAVKKQFDKEYTLRPKFASCKNICDFVKTKIAKYDIAGASDVNVYVASTDTPDVIATGGTINYNKADTPNSSLSGINSTNVSLVYIFELNGAFVKSGESRTTIGWDCDHYNAKMSAEKDALTWDTIKGENTDSSDVKSALTLPQCITGNARTAWSEITWSSSEPDVISLKEPEINAIINPVTGEIHAPAVDTEVTLTAIFTANDTLLNSNVESVNDFATYRKTFTVTVKGTGETGATEEELQKILNKYYTADRITDFNTKEVVDLSNCKSDLRLPRYTRIEDENGKPVFENKEITVTSDTDAIQINGYAAYLDRFTSDNDVTGHLTVTFTRGGVSASKQIAVTIKAITDAEKQAELKMMQAAKDNYFAGINDGQNTGKDSVKENLHPFQEMILDENGNPKWIYNYDDRTGEGIIPDSQFTDPWIMEGAGYNKFKSSNNAVITHENLLVTRREDDTQITISSVLSSERYGKFAEKHPENEFLQQVYKQPVSVTVTVKGTKEALTALPDRIKEAKELAENIVEGTEPGQYKEGTKAALEAAIKEAEDANAQTEEAASAVLLKLNKAVKAAKDAQNVTTATITVRSYETAEADAAIRTIEVTSGDAEKYGYEKPEATRNQVTIADALYKLHAEMYGDQFTENPTAYLGLDSNGYISRIFKIETMAVSTLVNNKFGDVANVQVLKTGDELGVFLYKDTTGWSDMYLYFENVPEKTVTENPFTITVKGTTFGVDEPASACTVEMKNQDTGKTITAVTDKNGKVTLSADQAGTYQLTVTKASYDYFIAPKATVQVEAHSHSYTWKTISKATVFQPEKQQGTCSICGKTATRSVGKKLTATIKLNAKSIKLQQKQTTKKIKVTMANGDSVKSWKSSNKKIVTVNKKGVIKAGKKNGTAKITVTLASGKKATLKVKVQSPRVNTTKIKGLKSKVSLKKGEKLTLKPAISPLTSQDKVTYTSSNKKVATVSKKGVITAKKKGTVKITVKSGKKSYTVKVKVK